MPSVLHVLASNDRRGAEVFACDLADALEPLGWKPTVVSISSTSSNASVPAVPLGDGLGARTVWRLRQLAQRHEVVVAHGSTALPACALACTRQTPFVYRSIGDPAFWSPNGLKRGLTTHLLNRSHIVVSLFPSARESLLQRGVSTPVRVIPRGVPSKDFPPVTVDGRLSARAELGLAGDRPIVLYLGALSSEKRPDRAVRLAEARSDVDVVIVGDGPLQEDIQRQAAHLANVHLHRSTSHPARYLAAADLVVLPSDTEGTPGVAIEAGFSALPVVASDVGGVATVVEHGVTGLLVPPGDDQALEAAVGQALVRSETLGKAARARCLDRFDLASVARAWSELLCEATRLGL